MLPNRRIRHWQSKFVAKLVDLARLRREFSVFYRMARIPLVHACHLWLIIDEIIANTADHTRDVDAVMSLSLDRGGEVVRLIFGDGTQAFDPSENMSSHCKSSPLCRADQCLESVPVGGLGLQLVAGLSDAQSYRRQSHRNIVTIWYILPRRYVRYRGSRYRNLRCLRYQGSRYQGLRYRGLRY